MCGIAGSWWKQRLATIGCGALILIGISPATADQVRLMGASDAEWTVLTMAMDGSWGAATEEYLHRALANAITRCRAMSGKTISCGAYSVNVQRGWAVGVRCGNENILASGATLAETIERVQRRADELHRDYHPGMAACRIVIAVTPDGPRSTQHTGAEITAMRMRELR